MSSVCVFADPAHFNSNVFLFSFVANSDQDTNRFFDQLIDAQLIQLQLFNFSLRSLTMFSDGPSFVFVVESRRFNQVDLSSLLN